MKPKTPVQAEKFCITGFSKTAPPLPILWRKEMRVKVKKNVVENARAMETNTALAEEGAVSTSVGAFDGRTEVSKDNA
jgi:hypothetical protein